MRIGIIGAGRIGGNCARQFARGGHAVMLSSREPSKLTALAEEIGEGKTVGTPAEVKEFADVVVIAVPWDSFDEAVTLAGSLDGKNVIDTTKQFGSGEIPPYAETPAIFHASRVG